MNSEEEYARRKGLNVRDALIFLVDFRTPMLRQDEAIQIHDDICSTKTSSLLSISLRCIADVMKSKIIARNNDAVGVVAFGTRGKVARHGWPGVTIIRPLKPSDAAAITKLQRIAQRLEAGEANHLIDMDDEDVVKTPVNEDDQDFCFGPDSTVEFDKALWAVRHQFTTATASRFNVLHRKRVFVFTSDADPSRGNSAIRNLCVTQANDLSDMGATLDVSLLTSPRVFAESQMSEDENEPTFFNDLVYADEDSTEEVKGSVSLTTVYSFEELCSRIRKKDMTKRALRKTVLVLGNDYKVGVALYALVRKATRPTKVELVAATNKPVFKITTNTCEQVGEILKPSGIRTTFTPEYLRNTQYTTPGVPSNSTDEEDGSSEKPKQLVFGFTRAEVVKARALGNVGLYMYGFRKRSSFQPEYTLGPATFVYPDETEYIGSTKSFAALHKSMLSMDVMGIVSVRLSPTSSTGIRFAALIPQEERFGKKTEHIIPGGFNMHYLPYKDDIYTAWRSEMDPVVKEEDELEIKQEDIEAEDLEFDTEPVRIARRMINKLKIAEYSPNLFLNPDLQRFYSGLENAAGVETRYNPQDELLNPDIENMERLAGTLAKDLKRLVVGSDFDGDEEAERFGTKGKKRAAEQSEAAVRRASKKRADMEKAKQECDVSEYIALYREEALGSLLKADLQLYCRANGLPVTGPKSALVLLVEDHIKDHQLQKNEA